MAINMIYGVVLPCVAVVFSLASFVLKKNVLPPLLCSLFWFVSAYAALSIEFVLSNESNITYSVEGAPEFVWLFGGLGLLFGVYALMQVVVEAQDAVEAYA